MHQKVASMSSSLTTQIQLNDREFKLFDDIAKMLQFYNLQTTVRVVGGWVRDKLLNRLSDDIDLSVDDVWIRICHKHD